MPTEGFGELGKVIGGEGTKEDQERKLLQADIKGKNRIVKRLPEEDTEKEFTKEGVALKIKGYRKREDTFIESVLSQVPSRHLNGIPSISVSNNTLVAPVDGVLKIARADYDKITKEIALHRKKVKMLSKKEVRREEAAFTILHEIGHHNYKDFVPDDIRREIIALVEREGLKLFNEKKKNIDEYYADAYACWYSKKKKLAKKHKSLYTILEKVFGENE